jgi:hypothetical protein
MVPELCALRFFTIGHMDVTFIRGFFSTPFHIGTWNFPWGSSELSYTLSLRFIIVTPMVPELCALRFFTIGHMHVTVLRGVFYTVSYRNLKLFMKFFWIKLHIDLTFHYRNPHGSGVACRWIFYYRTYACNSFPGFSITKSGALSDGFHHSCI